MLVIGIVMLFSTSAFAREQSQRRLLFHQTPGSLARDRSRRAACSAALVDYHFWQRTWWIWFGLALVVAGLLFRSAFRNADQRLAPLARSWPVRLFNLRSSPRSPPFSFSPAGSRVTKKRAAPLKGFVFPFAIVVGSLLALIVSEVDLGTTALIGATDVRRSCLSPERIRRCSVCFR